MSDDEPGHAAPVPILRTLAAVKPVVDCWDRANRLHEQMPRLDPRRIVKEDE
jgi:hypothetical protein